MHKILNHARSVGTGFRSDRVLFRRHYFQKIIEGEINL